MRVYLARHGNPVAEIIDSEKPLSLDGRRQVEEIAEFLDGVGVRVGKVFHSGKARARETASIIALKVMDEGEVEQKDGLNPMDDVEVVAEWVNRLAAGVRCDDVLLVGHLPFMGLLTDLLVAETVGVDLVEFDEATVVCLEWVNEGKWRIKFVVGPRFL